MFCVLAVWQGFYLFVNYLICRCAVRLVSNAPELKGGKILCLSFLFVVYSIPDDAVSVCLGYFPQLFTRGQSELGVGGEFCKNIF